MAADPVSLASTACGPGRAALAARILVLVELAARVAAVLHRAPEVGEHRHQVLHVHRVVAGGVYRVAHALIWRLGEESTLLYALSHTTPHTNLHINKSTEA